MAVFCVTSAVAGDPLLDPGAIERRGIEPHGFRVGEHFSQRVDIVSGKLAQDQSRCLESLRGSGHIFSSGLCLNSFCGASSDYNLRDGSPE